MSSTILTIDTATPMTTVAVVRQDSISIRTSDATRRADNLLFLIDEVLTEAGISLMELTAIAVRRGLGSYTGLRVGVTVASALGWSHNIPVIGSISRKQTPMVPTVLSSKTVKKLTTRATTTTAWPTLIPIYRPWHPANRFDTVAIMKKHISQ